MRAKQNSKAAENNYRKTLEKLNKTVEHFHSTFKPLLGQLQEAEVDYIEFFKLNMKKFSTLKDSIGKFITETSKEMEISCEMIDAKKEVQQFIRNNKSGNCNINAEEFQEYNEQAHMSKKFDNVVYM